MTRSPRPSAGPRWTNRTWSSIVVDDAGEFGAAADEVAGRELALEDGVLKMVAVAAHGFEDFAKALVVRDVVTDEIGLAQRISSFGVSLLSCAAWGDLQCSSCFERTASTFRLPCKTATICNGAVSGTIHDQIRVDGEEANRGVRQIAAPVAGVGKVRQINELAADDGFHTVGGFTAAFLLDVSPNLG